ncbi:30S ribosomal protein S17 [Solirubrobacter soli]|uniref:30S ribosomal protein S17 n=1 Tax=Solirubrobacter soli TaxID=363832 RepID=UPI0004060F4C
MAESEETTTETTEEVTSTEATADAAPASEEPTATRKERNAAARAAKAKTASGPRTLEDRLAERAAHKERNAKQRRAYRAKQKVKRAEARAAAPVAEEQHAPEHGPGRPKVRQGIVVSAKADKTIVVRVDIARRHKRYHKILRSSVTLHAHDESNNAQAGDTVRVQECRPMSRTKRWRLLDVLERAR